jgi:hypothetical protein
MEAQKKRIVLFDVDGTLVKPMGVRQYDNNRNKGEIEGLITFVVRSEQRVTPEMSVFLEDLRKILPTAIVGGSNFDKQRYQIGEDGTTTHPERLHPPRAPGPLRCACAIVRVRWWCGTVLSRFDYVFSENGLVAFKDGQPLGIEVHSSSTFFFFFWHSPARLVFSSRVCVLRSARAEHQDQVRR